MENLADLTIDELHLFKAIGPVSSVEFGVGVVGRELNIGDVNGALGIMVPQAMGAAERDAGEERLARSTVGPVDTGEEFFLRGGREVDVSFIAHEAGVVTCIGQKVRKGANAVGKGVFFGGAMLVGPDVVLMKAGHHGRARCRAHGGGGEGAGEADSFGGELIDVGRIYSLGAVAGEIGTPVFDGDPKDVGAGNGLGAGRED